MTVNTDTLTDLDRAREVASHVADPELPMVTLADLGILREAACDGETLVVTITPTYSGCPAMATIRADLEVALRRAGFEHVEVRTVLSPAWTTDWISEDGRRKLDEHGISPPHKGSAHRDGPIPLTLTMPATSVRCPRCGTTDTLETSHFGSTACKSLYRCRACGEPFEHVKEI